MDQLGRKRGTVSKGPFIAPYFTAPYSRARIRVTIRPGDSAALNETRPLPISGGSMRGDASIVAIDRDSPRVSPRTDGDLHGGNVHLGPAHRCQSLGSKAEPCDVLRADDRADFLVPRSCLTAGECIVPPRRRLSRVQTNAPPQFVRL